MSAAQFVDAVAVFQGAQGKFYLVNNQKYHIRFPMDWAHNHITFRYEGEDEWHASGPEQCMNCKVHGSIRGVFVGYCCNCLQNYADSKQPRGGWIIIGLCIERLKNEEIWAQYPYMYNVPKSEIGDEEGAEVTDEGIDLERLAEAINAAEDTHSDQEEEICADQDRKDRENHNDDTSLASDDATINSLK